MTQLKPCPFCGDHVVYNVHDRTPWVECGECGASGPAVKEGTSEAATEAWNTRANTLTDAERAVVEAAAVCVDGFREKESAQGLFDRIALLAFKVEALQKERER